MSCIDSVLVGLRLLRSAVVIQVESLFNCSCTNIDRSRNFCPSCGKKNNVPETKEVVPHTYQGYPVVPADYRFVYLAVHRTQTNQDAKLDLAWLEQERVKLQNALGTQYHEGHFGFFSAPIHADTCVSVTCIGKQRCYGHPVIGLRVSAYTYERVLITCECATERTEKYCSECGKVRRSVMRMKKNKALFDALDTTDTWPTLRGRRLCWSEDVREMSSHELTVSVNEEDLAVTCGWHQHSGDIIVKIDGFHKIYREDPVTLAQVEKEKEFLLQWVPDAKEENFGAFGQVFKI